MQVTEIDQNSLTQITLAPSLVLILSGNMGTLENKGVELNLLYSLSKYGKIGVLDNFSTVLLRTS